MVQLTKSLPLILAIDDQSINLKILDQALGSEFKLVMATRGEEGLELARQFHPDLILLDVQMPGIDGFETCRRLKADPDFQRIPVIFMTAASDTDDEIRGLELGAVDYILRPIIFPVARQRIRNHLALHALRQTVDEQSFRMKAIIDTIPDKLYELDRKGVCLGVWGRRESFLADPYELLRGHSFIDKLPPTAADIVMQSIGEADDCGTSYGRVIELSLRCPP